MLKLCDPILSDLSAEPIDLSPRRFGMVNACDDGLLEVSGRSLPVGAICRVGHGRGKPLSAEVIGFRNGKTMMMLLGDTILLRPGALSLGGTAMGLLVDGTSNTVAIAESAGREWAVANSGSNFGFGAIGSICVAIRF